METSATRDNTLSTPVSDVEDHGLCFTNVEWNGSISNGQPITLRWNESVIEGEMRLFKISYPDDGVVALEPMSNWTESIVGTEYMWTPEGLDEDELYALRITRRDEGSTSDWAISPPWKAQDALETRGFHWSTPVGVPILVILAIYFVSLFTCLMHRRRKHIKLEQQSNIHVSEEAAPLPENADRQGSVSSVITVQTLTEDDELIKKHEPVLIMDNFRFQDQQGHFPASGEVSPRRHHLHERSDYEEGPRVQFWENSFDPEVKIGQAR